VRLGSATALTAQDAVTVNGRNLNLAGRTAILDTGALLGRRLS